MNRWKKKYPNKWVNRWTMITLLCFIGFVLKNIMAYYGIDGSYFLGIIVGCSTFGIFDYFDSL